MLKVVPVRDIRETQSFFDKEFDFQKSTWIVSDLTSKLFLQKRIFQKQRVVPDESLLRAQEFWLKLSSRHFLNTKFLSQESLLFLTKQYISETSHEWAYKNGVALLCAQYLEILMPILNHENGHELMKEYFQNQVHAYERWGHWYLLCHEIYKKFQTQGMMHPRWAPSALYNEELYKWDRPLYFDLGSQIQPIEAELIYKISQTRDVTVLVPTASWAGNFKQIRDVYENFYTEFESQPFEYSIDNCEFKKFTTQLSEVQASMVKLREWVGDQVSLENIAISSPDMGEYWPVLSCYLKTEGVPSLRGEVAPLKTFPQFQRWISRLFMRSQKINFFDLEIDAFSSDISLGYEDFVSEFKNLYSPEELKRKKELEHFAEESVDPFKKMSVSQFVRWALPYWDGKITDSLRSLLNKLFSDFSQSIEFSLKDWVDLLDQLLGRVDILTEEASSQGIHCLDITSLRDAEVSHIIFLGLSDQGLRRSSPLLIQESDMSYLKTQYGVSLSPPERVDLEFEIFWNLQSSEKKYCLYLPQSNFSAQQLAPSRVWFLGNIQCNKNSKEISTPSNYRLIREQELFELQGDIQSEFIKRDLGGAQRVWFPDRLPESLSASQIESYLKCPFIQGARKLLGLKDLPELDLDIDYQTRGSVLHAAAEILFNKYPSLVVTEKELESVLDQAFSKFLNKLKSPELLESQKKRYFSYLKSFVEFERNLRSSFPKTKTAYIEQDIQVTLDPSLGDLSLSDSGIPFRGRIDRIDIEEDLGVALVLDYKFSNSSHKNYSSWMKEDELQLLLYMRAIEQGALGKEFEVIGATYYGFKEKERGKGFLDKDQMDILYGKSRRRNFGGSAEKQALYSELREKLIKMIGEMKSGIYEPHPKDIKTCDTCKWRTICRAPHLS